MLGLQFSRLLFGVVPEGLVFLFPIVKEHLTIKDSFDFSSRKFNVKN
ncbi:hypothetical protein SC09_Contig25orf00590 [Bacillus subtilis]|uniref:Uncharacterized protein n=1 Tax=Bacillus subtilis TaxID=1423 RepID=A0A0D1KP77_BACIU|nr:hypothetical protein SC09_Contig25orf00590 [Bacillus subtilis]